MSESEDIAERPRNRADLEEMRAAVARALKLGRREGEANAYAAVLHAARLGLLAYVVTCSLIALFGGEIGAPFVVLAFVIATYWAAAERAHRSALRDFRKLWRGES